MIDPDIHRFLADWDAAWATLPAGAGPQARRGHFEGVAASMREPHPPGIGTREHHVPVAETGSTVRVREFRPQDPAGPLPALVYLHGGAWMQGSPETHWDITAGIAALFLKPRPVERTGAPPRLRDMFDGLHHIWREKTILGALTLDLLAVLFGGATALLPVYAKDILHCGPIGNGALRAAPYLGAFLMAVWLAARPKFRHAGRAMLWSVRPVQWR